MNKTSKEKKLQNVKKQKTKKAFDKLAKKVVVGNKMHVLAKKSQKCILMKEILILTVNLYANASNKKIISTPQKLPHFDPCEERRKVSKSNGNGL